MNTNNNIRYRNTEAAIEKAFLELLEVKGIRQITVQELCNIVKINRSTFYAHYQDIYDLLNKTEDKLNSELNKKFQHLYHNNPNKDFIYYIKIFLEFAAKNKAFYKNFVNSQESFPIKKGFDELMNNLVIPYYKSQGIHSKDEIMYRFVFMQAGFTTVLKHWLNSNCKDSYEKVANIILSCIIK